MLNIGLEQQQQIRGADGTLLWSGGQVVATSYIAKNSDVTAAPDILMGECVILDVASSLVTVIPRQETTAAGGTPTATLPMSLNLAVRRNTGATDPPVIGVALEPIGRSSAGASGTLAAGTTYKSGLIAGPGSLVTCKSTATAIALGVAVGPSATVGAIAANATVGSILGICVKINTAGASGTQDTAWAGVLITCR